MIISGFLCAIGLLVYLACPVFIQFILLIINGLTADPIPFIDEIIMAAGMIKKIQHGGEALDFLTEHPIVILMIIGVIGYIFVRAM